MQDGLTSLHAASLQGRHLSDEAKQHLAEQLVLICQLLASRHNEQGERDPQGALTLIAESAFNLSAKPEYQEDALVEVSALLNRMIDAWPSLAANLRPIIQRFCEELPPTQAKHFWPLLIRLRAER